MARLISTILLIGFQSLAFSQLEHAKNASEYSSKKLFGPEAFEFCGGHIELWIKLERASQSQLILKASPPADTEWGIANGNIIVEDSEHADTPIRFSSFQSFKVKKGSINTHIWTFTTSRPITEYKVALLPFTGCPDNQKPRGVILKEYKLD